MLQIWLAEYNSRLKEIRIESFNENWDKGVAIRNKILLTMRMIYIDIVYLPDNNRMAD